MINVLYTYLSQENHADLVDKYVRDFPYEFRSKINNYKRWQDKQSSILGRLLLRQSLQYFNLSNNYPEIEYSTYNKPYFKESNIFFNISHSNDLVVCAINDTYEIGIDVEKITPINIVDFKSQMTDLEWQKLFLSDNQLEAFFDYWTQKEAIIKAHGMGLSIPLDSFEVADNKALIGQENFWIKEIKIDQEYKCNISIKSNTKEEFSENIILIKYL